MKFKFLQASLIGWILLTNSFFTNAALITDEWTVEVLSTNNSHFLVGDSLSWSMLYDDTSLIMHEYSNGSDGIGQTADDSLNSTLDASCQNGTYCGVMSLMTDIDYTVLDVFYAGLISGLDAQYGLNNYQIDASAQFNYSWLYHMTSGSNRVANAYGAFNFHAYSDLSGFFSIDYRVNGGNRLTSKVNFSQAVSSLPPAQSVPEPSTLAILGLALMGLGLRLFTKK